MPTMVPDRGDDPKRKHIWDVHNQESGEYQYSFHGGDNLRQSTRNKHFGSNLENEIIRASYNEQRNPVYAPKKRQFKKP